MSQALASVSSSGGPQWQVDIPGLSQIILSAGSYGLKQLALSGVDIHTVGCMLMIAENTPASIECRKLLSRVRDQQRNERYWMYKVVEIGAATNFLADQFLKTRAGENVVALLSSVVPVMDEDASVIVLSTLFEASGVSLENIPGRNQLINVRKNLAALTRRSGFGDKVLHYHFFLQRLLPRSAQSGLPRVSSTNISFAIPAPDTISYMIRLLHKLSSSDESYILVHNGIRGAAWLVTYATFILGLTVCALDANAQPVPITGQYGESKVVLQISAGEGDCSLFLEGEMQEVVRVAVPESPVHRGWSINCMATSFIETLQPNLKTKSEFMRISTFAAIECFNSIADACVAFQQWTADAMYYRTHMKVDFDQSLEPYVNSVIHKVQQRGLQILYILGFQPPRTGYHWEEIGDGIRCTGHHNDPPVSYKIVETGGETHEVQGILGTTQKTSEVRQQKIALPSGQYMNPGFSYLVDASDRNPYESSNAMRLRFYLEDPQNPESGFAKWPVTSRQSISDTVNFAALFTARMAFTDWDTSVRLMSVSALSSLTIAPIPSDSSLESIVVDAIQLCSDGVNAGVLDKRRWTDDWIALDLDGLIVFRYASMNHSIDQLAGRFVGFQIGSMEFEGSKYSNIRTDRALTNAADQSFITDASTRFTHVPSDPFVDAFPDCRLRPLLTVTSDTLFLRLEAYLRRDRFVIVDGTLSAKNLSSLLVTRACSHVRGSTVHPMEIDTPFIRSVTEGLFFCDERKGTVQYDHTQWVGGSFTGSPIYIQQTRNNAVTQWLALQWKPKSEPRCLRILQRDCCIGCIYRIVGRIVRTLHQSDAEVLQGGYPVCIIAGTHKTSLPTRP